MRTRTVRSLAIAAAVVGIVLGGVGGAAAARAEIPNQSIESLTKGSAVIATGAVVEIHVSRQGARESRLYTIAVEKCDKGGLAKGSRLMVRTWHQRLLPGTVGSTGHRQLPSLGQVTTVYAGAPQKDAPAGVYELLAPNGAQQGAELFVTAALVKDGKLEKITAAAEAAMKAGAWQEGERGWRRALELHEAADLKALEYRMNLGRCLAGQGRMKEAAETVLRAAAAAPQDLDEKMRQRATWTAVRAAFEAEDEGLMVRIMLAEAERTGTRDAWESVAMLGEFLEGPEAARAKERARTELEKLPGKKK